MVFKKVIRTNSGIFVVGNGLISRYNRERRKLCNGGAGYAGLIMCLVSLVFCDTATDSSKSLTYNKIYNNTDYVHLPYRSRTYSLPIIVHKPYKNLKVKHQRYNVSEEGAKGNELEYEEYNDIEGGDRRKQLLVGFAHDPFRYSIPEEDYLKGVRVMEPSAYMKKKENRGKRGVLHLYNMVSCTTGCNPLTYLGYGCYCGFLGDGRPTDGIDECCNIHDKCYENFRCPFYTVYFQPYLWKCSGRQALCALENYQTQHNFINGCAAQLCECDRQFAMCIKKYRCPKRKPICVTSPIRLLQNLLFG